MPEDDRGGRTVVSDLSIPAPVAARAFALADLADEAMRMARADRNGATRCTGKDHEYLIKRAETLESVMDRLRRDAQRGERG